MFYGVDPLAEKYIGISSYVYVGNNPLIRIDPDGREWDIIETNKGTIVSVDVKFENNANLSDDLIRSYQKAMNAQFNNTMLLSSNGSIGGQITFNGGSNEEQLTPSLSLYKGDGAIGGFMINGSVSVNVQDKNGDLSSPENLAFTAIHELLHTLRIEHPFEITQSSDTQLFHISGNNYSLGSKTDPNIDRNIMNYSSTLINGMPARGKQNLLTAGQINLMLNEIGLQKQGYGMMPRFDRNASMEFNQQNANRLFIDYWNNTPGKPVIRNN